MRQHDPWTIECDKVDHDLGWTAGFSAPNFYREQNSSSLDWNGDGATSNVHLERRDGLSYDGTDFATQTSNLGGQLHLALFTNPGYAAYRRIGHQPDLFMNFLNAPAVELATVAQIHFGIVLPKLRSLLPCKSPQVWLSAAETPANEQVFAQTYLGLLFLSLSNNFSGLQELPSKSILEYMESRLTRAQIVRFVNSLWPPAARAFRDNLLRCAVTADNAPVVEFIFSEQQMRLEPDKIACQRFRGAATLLEYSASRGNLEIVKILLRNGADVNRSLSSTNPRGPLALAVRYPRGGLNVDLILLLLQHGADVKSVDFDELIWGLGSAGRRHRYCGKVVQFTEQDSEGICLLMEHGARELCHEWSRTGFIARAMCLVNNNFASRIAEIAFKHSLDLNIPVLFPQSWDPIRDWCNDRHNRPVTLIDVIAKTGNGKLLQRLHEYGTSFTDNSLMYAIEGGDWDAVHYLARQDVKTDVTEPSRSALDEIAKAVETRPFELESCLPQGSVFFEVFQRELYRARLDAAIKRSNLELMKQLMSAPAPRNATTSPKRLNDEVARSRAHSSSLMTAIDMRNEEVALLLIDTGVSFDEGDHDAARVLCAAIEWRNVSVLEALLATGIHPRGFIDTDGDQVVPLLSAVDWGDMSVIEMLVISGADLNLNDMDDPEDSFKLRLPITIAIQKQDTKLAKLLLDLGAKINPRKLGRFGADSALEAAVKNDDLDMIKLLLAYGATVDDKGAWVASIEHGGASLELLLSEMRRIYPSGKNRLGTKALQIAIRAGKFGAFKLLLEHRIDIQCLCETDRVHTYESPLATAISTNAGTKIQMIEMLLYAGANLNGIIEYEKYERYHKSNPPPRQTALLLAIETGDVAIVELLLRHGADVNFAALHGVKRTALQQAAELGDLDVVELLLQAAALVNAPPAYNGGATALQLAAMEGYVGTAELLITHGADVNGPTAKINGRTAIDGAAEHGRLDMVQFLLRHGAVLDPRDETAECNAIKLAKENGHLAVADFLDSWLRGAGSIEVSEESVSSDPDSERPVCQECQKTFKNASSLTRHRRTKHQSQATLGISYRCDLCTYTTNRKDTLERHTGTQHTDTGKVPCPGCGKHFRKDYLKYHRPESNGPCKDVRGNISLPVRNVSMSDEAMVF